MSLKSVNRTPMSRKDVANLFSIVFTFTITRNDSTLFSSNHKFRWLNKQTIKIKKIKSFFLNLRSLVRIPMTLLLMHFLIDLSFRYLRSTLQLVRIISLCPTTKPKKPQLNSSFRRFFSSYFYFSIGRCRKEFSTRFRL